MSALIFFLYHNPLSVSL